MTARIFVEGSLCMQTGMAGWGAYFSSAGVDQSASGPFGHTFPGAVTQMELAAVNCAFHHYAGTGLLRRETQHVTLCLRSGGTMAVLRWVFPEADFEGHVFVHPPKRLQKNLRELPALYELHDLVEGLRLGVSLRLVRENESSARAAAWARAQMILARGD